MRYHATFKENAGFYTVFGVFGLLMVLVGLRTQQVLFAAIGFLSICLLLLVRLRLYVACGNEALESRSLFRTSRVPWNAIREVKRAAETGFWASRFYGPFTYSFETSSGCLKINFKFYSRECSQEILQRVSAQLS